MAPVACPRGEGHWPLSPQPHLGRQAARRRVKSHSGREPPKPAIAGPGPRGPATKGDLSKRRSDRFAGAPSRVRAPWVSGPTKRPLGDALTPGVSPSASLLKRPPDAPPTRAEHWRHCPARAEGRACLLAAARRLGGRGDTPSSRTHREGKAPSNVITSESVSPTFRQHLRVSQRLATSAAGGVAKTDAALSLIEFQRVLGWGSTYDDVMRRPRRYCSDAL